MVRLTQGLGNYSEVGERGGKRLPGSKITPATQNSPDLATIFWEGTKLTCKNKNKNERH